MSEPKRCGRPKKMKSTRGLIAMMAAAVLLAIVCIGGTARSDDASATLAMALDNQDGLKKSYNLRYASGEGSIAAGYFHSIGLYRDGTVVATGDNFCGECDVSGWTGIGCGLTLE